MYGEVSPSQRFKSNEVSYAAGLSKLTNMYVRRDGGVSNRPGLEFVRLAPTQSFIFTDGRDGPIKGYSFFGGGFGTMYWKELEFYKTNSGYFLNVDQVEQSPFSGITLLGPEPATVNFGSLKEHAIAYPGLKYVSGGQDLELFSIDTKTTKFNVNFASRTFAEMTDAIMNVPTVTPNGTALGLPVTWAISAVLFDGQEVIAYVGNHATYHPHASMSVKLDITLADHGGYSGWPTSLNNIKFLNIYRAAGNTVPGTGLFLKLVGRIPYTKGATSFSFTDYGADNPAFTPPVNEEALFYNGTYRTFRFAQAACYYQQRLIVAYKADAIDDMKAGDAAASKIGAPEQLKMPLIYSDTEAFKFSIPITDGTPILHFLPMERLIAFTARGVYVIRGGDQGILTPTQVNPLLISSEGVSSTVHPVMVGRKGFFINNTHTKLMTIEFGVDGNLSVSEASILAGHMFLEDVKQIEAIHGEEDTVFILRRDGKLVRVTSSESGASGFALVETNGYVESMFRGKNDKFYLSNSYFGKDILHDVLMCYVIRNGVRTLERLAIRDDVNKAGEMYADCAVYFGTRLVYGNSIYARRTSDGTVYGGPINLTTATNWNAGSTIKLTMETSSPYEQSGVFTLYYIDEFGESKSVRFIPDWATHTTGVGTMSVDGYFEVDVPTYLRNVNGQALTQPEKDLRQSWWLPAFNSYTIFPSSMATKPIALTTSVTVFADGEIVSSPLNPNKPSLTLTDVAGDYVINLPDYYSWGYVGLPYQSEFETLDLETSDNRTLTDAKKLISRVGLGLMETRAGFIGMPDKTVGEMEEIIIRDDPDFANQTKNFNGHISFSIPAEYTESGRVNIKNVDPAPITILSIYPKGIAGE